MKVKFIEIKTTLNDKLKKSCKTLFTRIFILFVLSVIFNTDITYCAPTTTPNYTLDEMIQYINDADLQGLERLNIIVERDLEALRLAQQTPEPESLRLAQQTPEPESLPSATFGWRSLIYFTAGTIVLYIMVFYHREIIDNLFCRLPNIVVQGANGLLEFANVGEFRAHLINNVTQLYQTETGRTMLLRDMAQNSR